MKYNDYQLLLYVEEEKYDACVAFYRDGLGLKSFYSWDEGTKDRGIKFQAGGAVIVVLTQENPFPEYGSVHFQLEVSNLAAAYEQMKATGLVTVTMEPFVRPYGWKEYRIVDPAGNHINIYELP